MQEAVVAVLRSARPIDRLKRLLVGGLTARQIQERLATDDALDVHQDREAVRRVTLALDALVQRGRVERRRARVGSSLIDVYRLS